MRGMFYLNRQSKDLQQQDDAQDHGVAIAAEKAFHVLLENRAGEKTQPACSVASALQAGQKFTRSISFSATLSRSAFCPCPAPRWPAGHRQSTPPSPCLRA